MIDDDHYREAIGEDDVNCLWLSVRAANVLKNMGCKTISALLLLTPKELHGEYNCGKKTVEELTNECVHIRGVMARYKVYARTTQPLAEFGLTG